MMDLLSEKDYDRKIVSANDFTICMKMTDEMNAEFLAWFRKESAIRTMKDSYIQIYEDHLSKELEKFIQQKRPFLDKKECKVADLQFGFDNAKLLNFLEQRANALRKPDFEKARKIEK